MKHQSRQWAPFATATRYALTEHLRNRFAMVLIAIFIPLWTTLAFTCVPATQTRSPRSAAPSTPSP
jgi:hypothetical protein